MEIFESPKIEKDFTFLKWFLSVTTVMIIGFGAFLFNLAIQNQTHIREALIEIKNIKQVDRHIEGQIDRIAQRFDALSSDPVHGWGQRWSRAEAIRENERQDKKLDRLENQTDRLQTALAELRVPLSKIEAEHTSVLSLLNSHVNLPAHFDAGNTLTLLQSKVENILEKLEQHDKHRRGMMEGIVEQ